MSKPSWGAWDRSPHLLGPLFCEAEESSTPHIPPANLRFPGVALGGRGAGDPPPLQMRQLRSGEDVGIDT